MQSGGWMGQQQGRSLQVAPQQQQGRSFRFLVTHLNLPSVTVRYAFFSCSSTTAMLYTCCGMLMDGQWRVNSGWYWGPMSHRPPSATQPHLARLRQPTHQCGRGGLLLSRVAGPAPIQRSDQARQAG